MKELFKNLIILTIFFFLLVGLLFFGISRVWASDYTYYNLGITEPYNQVPDSSGSSAELWTSASAVDGFNDFPYKGAIPFQISADATLDSIELYFWSSSGLTNNWTGDFQVWSYASSSNPDAGIFLGDTETKNFNVYYGGGWTDKNHTFNFNSKPILTASTTYWLVMITDSANYGQIIYIRKPEGQPVDNNNTYKYQDDNGWYVSPQYFYLPWFKLTGTLAPTNSVEITYPVNNTSLNDFSNWSTSYINLSTSTSALGWIYYNSTSTNLLTSSSSFHDLFFLSPLGFSSFDKSFVFPTSTTWYAQAVLVASSTIYASSPVITFDIIGSNSTSTNTPLPPVPPDSDLSFWGMLWDILKFIFFPQSLQLNSFQTSVSNMINIASTRFPFRYFAEVKSEIDSNLGTTGTSTPDLVIVVPFNNQNVNFVLLSASSGEALVGSSSWTTLRNIFSAMIWFTFGFMMLGLWREIVLSKKAGEI